MPKSVHGYQPCGNIHAAPGRWVPAIHETFGTKVLLYPFEPVGGPDRANQLQELQRTISNMGSPKLLPPFEANFSSPTPFICVLQEDLQPLAVSETAKLPTEQIDRMALNIAQALDRLHLDGLLMGLMTPHNLLTHSPVTPDSVLLSGFSHVLDAAKLPDHWTTVYTSPYAAPELLAYMQSPSPGRGKRLSPACDVFSFGIVYHELLTGTQPTFTTSPGGASGHLEELQLSRKLDYPHRQLLRRMMRLDPTERPQNMYALEKEINRLLHNSGCSIIVTLPELAGQMVSVRTGDVLCTRKRLDAAGHATFGPLLADQPYELTCQGKTLGEVRFPDFTSGQTVTFNATHLTQPLTPEASAPPPEAAPDAARSALQAELVGILDQHVQAGATTTETTPAPTAKAEPAPARPAKTPAKEPKPDPVKPAEAPTPTKQPEPAPTKPAETPQPAQKAEPAPAKPAEAPQPTKKPAPAKKAAKAQTPTAAKAAVPQPAPQPAPARPAVHVLKRIHLDPPLNNIRLIEMLTPELCQLTLINHGVFRIRTADAHRYGIAHLIREEGR